jgi:hypothetical protein
MFNEIKVSDVSIDATPNDDYPIRILQEYRKIALIHLSNNTNREKSEDLFCKTINDSQDQRLLILDKAIEVLLTAKFKKGVI